MEPTQIIIISFLIWGIIGYIVARVIATQTRNNRDERKTLIDAVVYSRDSQLDGPPMPTVDTMFKAAHPMYYALQILCRTGKGLYSPFCDSGHYDIHDVDDVFTGDVRFKFLTNAAYRIIQISIRIDGELIGTYGNLGKPAYSMNWEMYSETLEDVIFDAATKLNKRYLENKEKDATAEEKEATAALAKKQAVADKYNATIVGH
jgi:hypothetical protein